MLFWFVGYCFLLYLFLLLFLWVFFSFLFAACYDVAGYHFEQVLHEDLLFRLTTKILKTLYQIAAFFWNYLIKLLSFICIDHRCRIRLFNIYFRFKKKKKVFSRNLNLQMLVHNGSYIKYLKE